MGDDSSRCTSSPCYARNTTLLMSVCRSPSGRGGHMRRHVPGGGAGAAAAHPGCGAAGAPQPECRRHRHEPRRKEVCAQRAPSPLLLVVMWVWTDHLDGTFRTECCSTVMTSVVPTPMRACLSSSLRAVSQQLYSTDTYLATTCKVMLFPCCAVVLFKNPRCVVGGANPGTLSKQGALERPQRHMQRLVDRSTH